MAETKVTRKELYIRIMEAMADDPQVVELCKKQIITLERPRKKTVNKNTEKLTAEVLGWMKENPGTYTNKELTAAMNQILPADTDPETGGLKPAVSAQRMSAVMRSLVDHGAVTVEVGEKASAPKKYTLV